MSASQIAGYVLRAGTAPGLSDAATLPLGPATAFATPINAIPVGAYFVRVSAVNASGEGLSSAELPITIGSPCTTPGAPVLVGSASNHVVSLVWTTPTGGPVTGYRVLAGLSPGLPTWSTFVGLTHTLSAVVPDGTYFVRVVAEAACGAGTPSNEVVMTAL